MYLNFLSLKVDEEITNRLKDEIKLHYGVTIDATTNQHVDNLQIRVSYFYITITHKPLHSMAVGNGKRCRLHSANCIF